MAIKIVKMHTEIAGIFMSLEIPSVPHINKGCVCGLLYG